MGKPADSSSGTSGVTDIALLVQIGTYERWDDVKKYAASFRGLDGLRHDMFVSVMEDRELYHDDQRGELVASVEREFPEAILTAASNRGTDIGPFLRQLERIIREDRSYRYIFKLHTKTVEPWTSDVCEIMASPEAIRESIALMERLPDVGVVGSNKWLFPVFQGVADAWREAGMRMAGEHSLKVVDPGPEFRKRKAREARFDWKFYVENHPDLIPGGVDTAERALAHFAGFGIDEFRFPYRDFLNELQHEGSYLSKYIAGSIFCCRAVAILPFLGTIDIESAVSRMETGYVKDDQGNRPTHTHIWERMFGLIAGNAGYRVYGT